MADLNSYLKKAREIDRKMGNTAGASASAAPVLSGETKLDAYLAKARQIDKATAAAQIDAGARENGAYGSAQSVTAAPSETARQTSRGVRGHSGSEQPRSTMPQLVGASVAGGAVKSAAGYTGLAGTLAKAADILRMDATDREIQEARGELAQSMGAARRALRNGDAATARTYADGIADARAKVTALEEEKEAQALRDNANVLNRAANRFDAAYEHLDDRADSMIANAQRGHSGAAKVLSDVLASGTQMLGDAPASFLAPGGGLALMGARVFGDSSQQARLGGGTVAEQMGYGLSNAAVEVLSEKMFDGLAGIYGKGGADDVVEKVIDKLAKNDQGRAALKVISSMGGEALEEVFSGALDPALESIYKHNNARDNYSRETAAEIAYSALIGGILGGLGGAAEIARDKAPRPLKGPRAPGASAAQPRAGETGQFGSSEGNPTSETNGAKMAQKTASNEAGAVGLVQQVRNVIPVMSGAPTVVSITGTEIPKVGTVVDRLTAFANSIGNKINRPGFGDVLFSRKRIKNAFIGHGIGDAKIDAFAAVPAVIQRGEQIGYEHNWKGRGYDSYVFTAPIEYKGSRDYLGVIVTKDASDSRYYVHEVVDADGNLIFEEKENAGDTSDERATLPGAFGIVASPANSDISIAQESNAVKSGAEPEPRRLAAPGLDEAGGTTTDAITEPRYLPTAEDILNGKASATPAPGSLPLAKSRGAEARKNAAPVMEAAEVVSSPAQDAGLSGHPISGSSGQSLGQIATQEFKSIVYDPAELVKDNGKTFIKKYGEDAYAAAVTLAWEKGDVKANAVGDLFAPKEQDHIDNRSAANVSPRSVQAFQFQNPEIQPYYGTVASVLMDELNSTQKGGELIVRGSYNAAGGQEFKRLKRGTTPAIAELLDDYGFSYNDVARALKAIMEDKGQENIAVAKRLEILIDDLIESDYISASGPLHEFVDIEGYREAKSKIRGAQEREAAPQYEPGSWEAYKASNQFLLDLGEVTEDELRAEWEAERALPPAASELEPRRFAAPGIDDGLGSARSGFDPFSAAENKYGTMDGGMKAVRPDDVPISTNGKDHVSRSVVSMKGAAVTPDAFVPLIENETMKGGFSYIPVSNDATTTRAESYIKRHGWDEALRNWTADVRAKRSGPDSTAIGALLYNNAVNSGDYRTALDILADFQDYATNTAQALQAIRILKTLTPENRLYMIERQLTKYNEQVAAQKQERNKQRNLTEADNVPVEEWMTRVGEDLADQLAKQGNVKKTRAKTVAETILSDLRQFYAEDGKPGAPAKAAQERETRTEFDRIYDLFQNQEHYQEAWDAARAKLAETLGENSEAMAAYDEWFQRAPDYTKRLTRMLTGEETLSISKELADRYLTAQTEAERDAVVEEMQKEIAEQLPSTLLDKWNALRYLNMLGNFKTQIRNVAGNVGMQMMTRTKDAVAAGIENLAYAVSGGKFERTKAFLPGKALRDAAKADFADVEKLAMGESRYDLNEGKNAGSSDILREAMDQRTIFKRADGKQGPVYKVLEAYRNATNWAMEQGDVIFSRASYSNALAGWLKAHNVTAKQFTDPEWRKANSELVDTARSYAIQEAQEATFRDTNTVSKLVSSAGRGKNVPSWAQVLGEGLMPFRKTPANVAVRAVEYGPLGVINSAASAVRMGLSSTNLVNRPGLMGALARSGVDITGTDVINELAKGLTGSALFVLGYWLRRNGFLRGGDDDDQNQEYFDDLNGHQNYALELPDGTSYTLDWVTPGAIPLFMGTALADGVKEGGLQLSDIEGAFTQIAEPMLQMSMLSSINDTLDSLKYSKDNLGQLAGTLIFSYLTQGFTNTLLGQIERTSETERMSTYVEHDSAVPAWLQRQLGKASAKTPGWDYHQYPYINAWGQTESSGDLGTRALTNFLSPGYVSQIDEGGVETELQRLADAVGATNVFPDNAPKYFSLNGETKYLTREEYVAYATEKGQLSRELIDEFLSSDGYAQMDDDARAKAISELYSYANAKAKESVFGIGLNSSAAKIEAAVESGISPAQYFTFNAKLDALTPLDGSKSVSDMQRFRVIAGEDMGDDEKLAAIGSIMGTDMTTESGGKSTYAKMLDTLGSGATLDQYLDLNEAGAVDSYLKYQSVQGDRDYGIEPEAFAQFQTGKSQYDADGNNSYTQKEVAAAIEGIFGDTLTAEQKAVLWQLYNKSWKPKGNPYSVLAGAQIYDGLHSTQQETAEVPRLLPAP